MVVQHNLTAMNSNRMLGVTTSAQAKSTEKLSSGYKINRAADDAAGLSISEKMRKQIRGLTQASSNAQDGISAVQTAEGALTEVHDMLQRMNELAVKAANGTNSEDDRNYIQDEIAQLVTEIDRVAETTKFNETYLLKGDANKTKVTDTVYNNYDLSLVEAEMAAGGKIDVTTTSTAGEIKLSFTSGIVAGDKWNGKTVTSGGTAKEGEITLACAREAEVAAMNEVLNKYAKEMGIDTAVTFTASTAATPAAVDATQTLGSKDFVYPAAQSLNLHVGADPSSNNKINMKIESMDASSLHIKDLQVAGKTSAPATRAIDTIAEAIQKVSTQRSALGAIQNRLEHTIANLDNVVENTTSAESAIRDTDMATEMVRYSNNNILAQAGQSMLAQANQANQGVLSLLQ